MSCSRTELSTLVAGIDLCASLPKPDTLNPYPLSPRLPEPGSPYTLNPFEKQHLTPLRGRVGHPPGASSELAGLAVWSPKLLSLQDVARVLYAFSYKKQGNHT